jgi:hypothetical protein
MMWHLFQAAIFFGFIAWNIADPWTPNPLVPGVLGAITAHLATEWGVKLTDWLRRLLTHPVFVGGPADNQVGHDRLSLRTPRIELRKLLQLRDRVR